MTGNALVDPVSEIQTKGSTSFFSKSRPRKCRVRVFIFTESYSFSQKIFDKQCGFPVGSNVAKPLNNEAINIDLYRRNINTGKIFLDLVSFSMIFAMNDQLIRGYVLTYS